ELTFTEGAELHERAAADVPKSDGREAVLDAVDALRNTELPAAARLAAALLPEVTGALSRHPLRELLTVSRPMPLIVERRLALGDRLRRRGPRRPPPGPGHLRGLRPLRAHRPRPADGGGPGLRPPVLPRPPLGRAAPAVVPPPRRRLHRLRREPAEEVPGHL